MILVLFMLAVGLEPPLPSSLAPSKELKQKFDGIVKRRRLGDRSKNLPFTAPSYTELEKRIVARLEEVEDHVMLVSMAVTKAQRRRLTKMGAREVLSIRDVGLDALIRQRHYRRFRVHSKLQTEQSLDRLLKLLGQRVQLTLGRVEEDAHLEVLSVSLVKNKED
ncbi:MAG: hypothetical protein KTR25_15710 [Myxococcales bacterium]|nr:hypothetical protein [Myxococcales bacterium]